MTEEQKKLVEDNHNLIYSFIIDNHMEIDDYYDIAAIGLCNAAMNYNPEKNAQFHTYAYKCMKYEVCKAIKFENTVKRKATKEAVHYQNKDEEGEDVDRLDLMSCITGFEDDAICNVMFNEYIDKLDKKKRHILLLLNQGYTQMEIAKVFGISHQWVSQIKSDAKKALGKKFKIAVG